MTYEEKIALLESLHSEVAGRPRVLGNWENAATFSEITADDFEPETTSRRVEAPPIDLTEEERARLMPKALWVPAGTKVGRAGIPEAFVRRMYKSYLKGMSLAKVGKHYGGRSRQSVFEMFQRRGFKLREDSRRKKKVETVYKGVEYSPAKSGYLRATAGDRKFLHWVIWEEHNGPVPEGCQIYFRDGNMRNFSVDNLACETRAEGLARVRNFENGPLKKRRIAVQSGEWKPDAPHNYDLTFLAWFRRHGVAIERVGRGFDVSTHDGAPFRFHLTELMIERLVSAGLLAATSSGWVLANQNQQAA